MADLIDRAALLKEIWSIGNQPWSDWETVGVVNLVNRQTAVDAVPVVRCSKCELHDSCFAENVFKTARMDLEKAFCCVGSERRTDADN